MREKFEAHVQYDDWRGNAAADDDGIRDVREILRQRGQLNDSEFLIGVEIWVGENYGGNVRDPQIHAIIIDAADMEAAKDALKDPVNVPKVKKVDIEGLSVEQFIGLFKRFSVALSWKDLDFTGREYETDG